MPMEHQTQTARESQDLRDRLAVSDIFVRFTCAIDSRDWIAYRSCFSDSIEIDYRSLIGGDVLFMDADAWTEQARQSFAGFECTQHFTSNHVCKLDGNRARGSAYICAEHFVAAGKAQEFWTMGGVYHGEFVRGASDWSMIKLRLEMRWSRGNPDIFELAGL